ncbi:major facilitator superfamily domain-containing protein [Syncephalis plumigaleata]|nr:major facilitator superfamily domain-containing protein [Syncephalis plumigaleata]
MIIGYVLYGLGSGSITVVQGTILSHWFRGKGLAIAMGLEVAISRLASYLSMATVVSIAQWTGFMFAALLCVLSWIVNLIYVLFMRYLHEEQGMEKQELARKKAFHPRNLLYFPSTFWFIIGVVFTLGSCWTIFLHFNTEMVKLRFGHNDQTSAYIASIAQILPIFFAPFQGYLHDYYGYRALTATMSTLTFIVSMLFFLWWPHLSPIIGMIVFSVSLTIGPVAIFSSVPLVLASSVVGTGLGVYKSTLNIGVSLLDIVAGMLQDYASHHDIPGQTRDEYSPVLAFCAIIGGIGFLFSLGVWWTDPHCVLQCGRRNRTEPQYIPSNPLDRHILEAEKKHRDDANTHNDDEEPTTAPLLPTPTTTPAISLPPVKWYSWMSVGLLTVSLLASWLLFILKLVHPKQ